MCAITTPVTMLSKLINRLLAVVHETCADDEPFVEYDTITSNVAACKTFTFRNVGRCYITDKNYGENCQELQARAFNGAQFALGSRWFYSTFPYHQSAEHLMPFAELYFNLTEFMVPMCDFLNISDGKKYVVINVMRSNGAIQRGIIKTDVRSMVVYRLIRGDEYIVSDDYERIEPIVKVCFNFEGTDFDFDSMTTDFPHTDCSKDVPVKRLIEINPMLANAFRIEDEQIPSFKQAFVNSAMNVLNAHGDLP